MNQAASELNMTQLTYNQWLIKHCEEPQNWFESLTSQEISEAIIKRGCSQQQQFATHKKDRNVKIWAVSIVKYDYASVPENVLWHLLLGIDHIIVYDNNDRDSLLGHSDSKKLGSALQPFIDGKYVSLKHIAGDGKQLTAYALAVKSAKEAGVHFMVTIDIDEFMVPFMDKCIPPMLQRCYHDLKDCGSIGVNWRMARAVPGNFLSNASKSIFSDLKYDIGDGNRHTKSFANLKVFDRFGSPHHILSRDGYKMYRDNMTKGEYDSPFQLPAEYPSQRVFIYHVSQAFLFSYVKKKSLRGRVSMNTKTMDKNDPQRAGDFGDLVSILRAFYAANSLDGPRLPSSSAEEEEGNMRQFLMDTDASFSKFFNKKHRSATTTKTNRWSLFT
jgi:hypothetical protein